MNGKVNEYHEAGSNDLVANGLRVGEEVTITRGTIVKDGVAEPALEFSVRGNVVSRVPITTQRLSDVYDAAVVPLKSKVKTFGRLGSGTRIAQPMTVSDVLNKPGQIAELAFYTVRERVPQFFRMFNPDVSIPEPTMKTVAQRKGKPYLYIKDTETGKMVYMPVEAQPIGVQRAKALLYLERAHAVASSGGLIQYPGMTLEQARQTMRNFEQAYGVDPRLSKVEKAKEIIKRRVPDVKKGALFFEGLKDDYLTAKPAVKNIAGKIPGSAIALAPYDFLMMQAAGAPFLESLGSAGSYFLKDPAIGKAVNVPLALAELQRDPEKAMAKGQERFEKGEKFLRKYIPEGIQAALDFDGPQKIKDYFTSEDNEGIVSALKGVK
jgi:hypothetical protein